MSYEPPLTLLQLREYEKSITHLKLPELQKIHEKLGLRKQGLKQDLITRLITLLKEPGTQRTVADSVDMAKRMSSQNNVRQSPYTLPGRNASFPAFGVAGGLMRGNMGSGYGGNGGSTMHSAQNMLAGKPNPAPKDLRLVPLPFYDVSAVLMEPMELAAASHPSQKYQSKQYLQFSLSGEQERLINYRADQQGLPRNEVQVRFFQTTTLNEPQKDDFPLNCALKLDEQCVTLPNVIPTNKPNAEPKRPSRPVDVTQICQRRTGLHRISVEWTADRRSWAVGVYFVYRVNTQILYERMMNTEAKHQSIELTKQDIVKRLGGGDDDGIAMDQIKVGLICPLVKVRMQMPARCLDCTHLQCFDLTSYLMMNEKRPVWNCPVCTGYAPYGRLIIDEYFKDVLDHVDNKTVEVELKPDGNYEILKEEEAFSISDDDDDVGVVKQEFKHHPKASAGESSSSSAAAAVPKPAASKSSGPPPLEADIITLSDSDDEDETLKRVIANSLRPSSPTRASSSSTSGSEPSTPKNVGPPASKIRKTTSTSTSSKPIEYITLDDSPEKVAPPKNLKEALDSICAPTPSSSSSSSSSVLAAAQPQTSQGSTAFRGGMDSTSTTSTSAAVAAATAAAARISRYEQQQQQFYGGSYPLNRQTTSFPFSQQATQHPGVVVTQNPGLIGRQLSNVLYPYDGGMQQQQQQMPMPNDPSALMNNNAGATNRRHGGGGGDGVKTVKLHPTTQPAINRRIVPPPLPSVVASTASTAVSARKSRK